MGLLSRSGIFRLSANGESKFSVAASLHQKPLREYMLEVLGLHLKELERRKITLTLPKVK